MIKILSFSTQVLSLQYYWREAAKLLYGICNFYFIHYLFLFYLFMYFQFWRIWLQAFLQSIFILFFFDSESRFIFSKNWHWWTLPRTEFLNFLWLFLDCLAFWKIFWAFLHLICVTGFYYATKISTEKWFQVLK